MKCINYYMGNVASIKNSIERGSNNNSKSYLTSDENKSEENKGPLLLRGQTPTKRVEWQETYPTWLYLKYSSNHPLNKKWESTDIEYALALYMNVQMSFKPLEALPVNMIENLSDSTFTITPRRQLIYNLPKRIFNIEETGERNTVMYVCISSEIELSSFAVYTWD